MMQAIAHAVNTPTEKPSEPAGTARPGSGSPTFITPRPL